MKIVIYLTVNAARNVLTLIITGILSRNKKNQVQ